MHYERCGSGYWSDDYFDPSIRHRRWRLDLHKQRDTYYPVAQRLRWHQLVTHLRSSSSAEKHRCYLS